MLLIIKCIGKVIFCIYTCVFMVKKIKIAHMRENKMLEIDFIRLTVF